MRICISHAVKVDGRYRHAHVQIDILTVLMRDDIAKDLPRLLVQIEFQEVIFSSHQNLDEITYKALNHLHQPRQPYPVISSSGPIRSLAPAFFARLIDSIIRWSVARQALLNFISMARKTWDLLPCSQPGQEPTLDANCVSVVQGLQGFPLQQTI